MGLSQEFIDLRAEVQRIKTAVEGLAATPAPALPDAPGPASTAAKGKDKK